MAGQALVIYSFYLILILPDSKIVSSTGRWLLSIEFWGIWQVFAIHNKTKHGIFSQTDSKIQDFYISDLGYKFLVQTE